MKEYLLKTKSLELRFCADTGALVSAVAPETGWVIHRRAELGLSWRLLVPVNEELRNNPVYGEKQRVSTAECGDDFVRFTWDRVSSERAGELDIKIEITVRAEDGGAVWYTRVENNSPYVVESVYSPYLGDLSHPQGASWFKTFLYNYATAIEWDLWPSFTMLEGDHSTDYPTQFSTGCSNPCSPYFLMRSETQGLYAGVKDSRAEYVAWHCELRPGYDSAIDGRVPEMDEIAGKPVHTRFAPVHMCYIQPGGAEDLTPIMLHAFVGGWQKGIDIYRRWRDSWAREAKGPAWTRDPHSWLQLHINSPEDELRMRFTELPKVAEECAKYGVKAIQLVGWNDGGQDQGNPSHSFDARLGTFDELKQAIADCQALGVKVILFSKFTWADRALEWFRKDLIDCAAKDPYGDYYHYMGYEYQTPAQLLDINAKRLIPMCFGSEKYMDVCKREFKKLLDLGCDGTLYDECQHHSPAQLCFDTAHNHKYGWPVYQNDREFVRMLRGVEGVPEDFLFAGEACYDWELEEYELAYFRSRKTTHLPVSRYMRPHAQLMTAVSGFNDRNMVNQCLMYRYVISYEPYNFKGWLHDYPDTIAYGSKMDALRTEYRRFFWDGEFRDVCGANVVRTDGAPHHPYVRYQAQDGRSALVISNYQDEPVCVTASLDEGALSKYRTVDEDVWHPVAGGIQIPVRSAVIVV
jgi:hypothetical protein